MSETFVDLTEKQIQKKINFIDDYKKSKNGADGSKVDANANVSTKNIATMQSEINKDINIQINRAILHRKIEELFDQETADEYVRQIESHEIYCHDESSLMPYCVAISMYPFLEHGMTKLGGSSKKPTNLNSFCGSFINLMFATSAQFAGAVAAAELLMYFDYFAVKEFGEDYLETNEKEISQYLQQIVYTLNQPAAARGNQSVFWNVSIFDEDYFNGIFEGFCFPDENFTKPNWKTLDKFQHYFVNWLREERLKAELTFPVTTVAMLTRDDAPKNTEFAEKIAEQHSKGARFFIYMSENPDSLSSCCRLRNEVSDNTFSHTLGAGGVATGSINVITMNINRLIQLGRDIPTEVRKIHKYQVAYRHIVEEYLDSGMLPVYDAGFITLKKQFLTIGINGLVEAAESQGLVANNNPEYIKWCQEIMSSISKENKIAAKKWKYMFNTEFVPAENLGVKNAKWDKQEGFKMKRDTYNSYFYPVEDESINLVDKFILHGEDMIRDLDGGSAAHINLRELLTKEGFLTLYKLAAKTGCNYFCTNVLQTHCKDCGHIDVNTHEVCPECNSNNLDYATRIIGYLKKVSSFSSPRQNEEKKRYYHEKS